MKKEDAVFAPAILFGILIVAAVVGLISQAAYNSGHYERKEYSLSEIRPGVYCVYSVVSSRVPAENYEIVTLCCNDQIITLKGDVEIIYSTHAAHVIIKDYNIVNGDEITVYVPYGTVKFQENFGI